MVQQAIIDRHVKHLIEVAVKQGAVPSDGNGRATHDIFKGGRIEYVGQGCHVIDKVVSPDQIFQKATDRTVCYTVQRIELNTVTGSQARFVLMFQRFLRSREKRANRIVDDVKP